MFTIIAYDDDSKIDVIRKYNITDNKIFSVPLYLLDTSTILFNGGTSRLSAVDALAKVLDAKVKKFVKTPKEEKEDFEEPEEVTIKTKYSESQVNNHITEFNVTITGARDGDFLIGYEKRSKNASIRIHEGIVKPRKKDLDSIRQYPHLWKKFITKLSIIPFFRDKSLKDRERWMRENQTTKDTYIGEPDEELWIEFLQPGENALSLEESQESLSRLMEGNPNHPQGWWKEDDITEIIPAKPGSRARRHTLIFNKAGWKLAVNVQRVDSFDGVTFDIYNGTVSSGEDNPHGPLLLIDDVTSEVKQAKSRKKPKPMSSGTKVESTKWERVNTQSIAMIVDNEEMLFNQSNMDNLILEIMVNLSSISLDVSILAQIRMNFKEYTSAAYKSLLQKLIRFRAKQVRLMDDSLIDTRLVLLSTMAALCLNPGSFVPDIQRYVTGLESFTKRLGVCVLEDSSVNDPTDLLSLLSGALLAQRVRTWRPSRRLVMKWFTTGLEALNRPLKYDFKIDEGLELDPYVISSNNSTLENCSAILDELRSFEGDIGLLRYIANKYDKATEKWSKSISIPHNEIMPIWHDVDQHWATGVSYFFDPALVEKIHAKAKEPASTPFAKLFSRIFREVTGYNPRKQTTRQNSDESKSSPFDESDSFIEQVRRAQHAYLIAKQTKQQSRPIIKGTSFVLEFALDISWLPGLVGAIEISGVPPVFVTMNAENPAILVAIKRPSRDTTDNTLSPDREEKAKESARSILRKGVMLNKTKAPSEFLTGASVFLRTDEDGNDFYIIKKESIEKSWEEARHIKISIGYNDPIEKNIENALTYTGDGIEPEAFEKLEELYQKTDDKVIRRALYYISAFISEFEMSRISMYGGAISNSVTVEDVGAYQFFLLLSQLFPAALRPSQYHPQKFTSPVAPLLWRIRDILKTKMSASDESDEWNGVEILDQNKRIPWEHQTSSLKEMIVTHERGIRGNFLYLSVGMGKSLIIMTYIQYLQAHNELPKYIIYSLPGEALKSVSEEILAFGLPVRLIIPLKTKQKVNVPKEVDIVYTTEAEPGYVNLIEHDHLKYAIDDLAMVADQSLTIFDEVHKMLRESQRTNAALQLSRLSKIFVVLTGTPIIDNKIYRLIPWLEQIVGFSVNEKNFWTAVSVMVSRKASTGVKTEHEVVWEVFTDEEEAKYKKLAPVGLGGNNTRARMEEIREIANMSYQAADRKIVNTTIELLGEKVMIKNGEDEDDWTKRKRGVMVVASTIDHQEKLKNMFINAGIKEKELFMITGKASIFLTDETVISGKTMPYKIVITTKNKSAGYTLTYLNSFVSGIYPSNQATREQLEGRINRIGQKADLVKYIYVGAGLQEEDIEGDIMVRGILPLMYENHNEAKSISAALASIAKDVGIKV